MILKKKMLMVLLLTFVVMGVEAQRKWYNPRMRLIGLTQLGAQRGWTTDMGFMFGPNNVTLERELIGTNENEIESTETVPHICRHVDIFEAIYDQTYS